MVLPISVVIKRPSDALSRSKISPALDIMRARVENGSARNLGKVSVARCSRDSISESERGSKDFRSCPLAGLDRKSTRLNSSHTVISYAVFCLKKKKKIQKR